MVLIHGGGGTAFHDWVRLWNKARVTRPSRWTHAAACQRGEYGHWERPRIRRAAGLGRLRPRRRTARGSMDVSRRRRRNPRTFARALVSGSRPRTHRRDGHQWGGYLTCIVAGVDNRFKCAVPVYGCGFLDDNSAWLEAFKGLGEEKTRQWISRWDPSVYLADARMPMLWVTGTNDFAYPMDSLRKSYRLPRGPRQLCLRMRMPHGHGGPGENPEEIRLFADSFFKGGVPLPKSANQGRDGNNVWATYESKTPNRESRAHLHEGGRRVERTPVGKHPRNRRRRRAKSRRDAPRRNHRLLPEPLRQSRRGRQQRTRSTRGKQLKELGARS